MNPAQRSLFPEANKARYGETRRHQSLFLPRLLERESADQRLRGEAQENAHRIIIKWADLEDSGKLEGKKETELEAEFLIDVFGNALGYKLFSEGEKQWNVQPKYFVNGGEADAAIGLFEKGTKTPPLALIEFKGPITNLDRDRFNGRTPVQQCWGYLNAVPPCPWGIVCNYVSFRLYHRNHAPSVFQHFALQDLKKEEVFRQFYYLFERGGLIPATATQKSRAISLLERTGERQQEVGDELYRYYHSERVELIRHLMGKPHRKTLEQAIFIAQRLIDRIIFVAFCEDRGLLPKESIRKAHEKISAYEQATNPRWRNFINLFRFVDKGSKRYRISPYNGGLFREDPEVDNLNLDDRWTDFFDSIGRYDFRDEVSVDVLGNLFEQSIRDIGQIRLSGLLGAGVGDEDQPKMKKSAERKRFGIYYTPPQFTKFITYNTVTKLIDERLDSIAERRGIDRHNLRDSDGNPEMAEFWRECLDTLRHMKIVDPACGSGAFLISAYDVLMEMYHDIVDQLIFHEGESAETLSGDIPGMILHDNLYGVDLSPEAVEITQLALWIRSAQEGKSLEDLSKNIVCGNSLVTDPEVDPRAMAWQETFQDVFSRDEAGFDCVIGNPPWERVKLQEREFFDMTEPAIASAVNAATRRKMIAKLKKDNPELHGRYESAKSEAEKTLDHVRACERFPLTGKGDINTYAVFSELAHNIVAPNGRVGLLVPSGIATDHTTKEFFKELVDSKSLAGFFDFENRKRIFPDVDGRYKFCILLFGGSASKFESADFVFFSHRIEEVEDPDRHIKLSVDDIKLLNPNTRTCPIFRSSRDAEITKAIYRRVPVLVDKTRKEGGNPWGVRFLRMFDQTNDAELFTTPEELKRDKYRRFGTLWKKGKKVFLPLYEAKMVQMYDHRAASVVVDPENWMRQGQTRPTSRVEHQNQEFAGEPRWWVSEERVSEGLSATVAPTHLAFKDVTSATNTRTMIAAFIPKVAVLNSLPLMILENVADPLKICCLLANLNSFGLDFVARQKVGGLHLNFFIVEQLPVFPPDAYSDRCPWNRRTTLAKWVSDRVLKLSCTSNEMKPLAEAAGLDPPVHKWKPDERAELMAELDAAYFLLYGIEREDVEYILSTFSSVQKRQDDMFGSTDTASLILKNYDTFQAKFD